MLLSFLLYIDPGTGSLIAQAVLAGIIAGWVFFKNSIRRIFFRSGQKDEGNDPEKQQ